MKKVLYVVAIIDTEGPTTGREDMVDSWNSMREAISALTGLLRNELKDSFSKDIIFSWFLLDWTGYSKNDPEFKKRGHDTKLYATWDFYTKYFLSKAQINQTGDGVYWHYHHPPKDGSWGWNKDWNDSQWYEYILGKLILDYNYFPSVYRAGKYVESNESSHWLEQWIPFDYSNVSPNKRDFCDWSKASTLWIPYHPHLGNYQLPGNMKRMIARSLPVAAKGGSGNLNSDEIEAAFKEVQNGAQAIFSFHTHDYYKSINDEFRQVHQVLTEISKKFDIPWKYINALDALRLHTEKKENELQLKVTKEGNLITISPNHAIFGPAPFVACEDNAGMVTRINTIKEGKSFKAILPDGTIHFGIGVADAYGNTATYTSKIRK